MLVEDGRGILQSRSHDCLVDSHDCLLMFTPSHTPAVTHLYIPLISRGHPRICLGVPVEFQENMCLSRGGSS